MSAISKLSRRKFLGTVAIGSSSLVVSFCLPGKTAPAETGAAPSESSPLSVGATAVQAATNGFKPNAYLEIDPQGNVTVQIFRSEMGQGVETSIPMILADELEADWSKIRIVQAPPSYDYGDQVTGGSVSISGAYDTLRVAGATARETLIAAAAQIWGVPSQSCTAKNGAVIHSSGKQLTYGELVSTASKLSLAEPRVKDAKDFHIIGTRVAQLDGPHFVDGSAVYGLDVRVPGMLYAAVARCPVFGGKVSSFDATKARAVEGVQSVVQIDSGVAVVADTTWHAFKGRDALQVKWDEGTFATESTATIRQKFNDLITQKKAGLKPASGHVVEATYDVPYLAHATMEPMNAVSDLRGEKSQVWAPTQNRQQALNVAHQAAGNDHPVDLHVPLIGGGFGRRLMVDYVTEAVQISKAANVPVQVVFSRADDIQHDCYRAASSHYLRAELDAQGNPTSWTHLIASHGVDSSYDLVEGANSLPYKLGTLNVVPLPVQLPIPTGYWRSVYNTQNAFANESFIDELAAASGQDPYTYRMALVNDPGMKRVLELAATKAGWGSALPTGWGRGIACHSTWNATPVAQVAEVSVDEDGTIHVHRVVCAVDCGLAVNPDMVEAQMEGGVIFGLSAALKGEITLEHGSVQQTNLSDYPILRMNEAPTVEVYIVPSTGSPTGIGEMPVPPIAPAVANAVFAATGKRIRQLPMNRQSPSIS